MGLLAARAAGGMQARQNYRTMARMQRRRSYVQNKAGMKEDLAAARSRPGLQLLPRLRPSPST